MPLNPSKFTNRNHPSRYSTPGYKPVGSRPGKRNAPPAPGKRSAKYGDMQKAIRSMLNKPRRRKGAIYRGPKPRIQKKKSRLPAAPRYYK